MKLTVSALTELLRAYPDIKHYRVALSGGVDSIVLLHILARLRQESVGWQLSAIHVHHGLNAAADDWSQFCESTCQRLNIPYMLFHVDATPVAGESPEATARLLRYQAFTGMMETGDALVTGHHQDDQAETLLLQLMRGCGAPGLAAMPRSTPFSTAQLIRPLLGFSQQQILDYASEQELDWVEDSSNSDHHFDRNFLRHEIMPGLKGRWPGLISSLCRTALNMADTSNCLDELAMQDWQRVKMDQQNILHVDELLTMSPSRLRNLLRFWLRQLNMPVPSYKQMQHILSDVIHAGIDSQPCVAWSEVEIRRYRKRLYALAKMTAFIPDAPVIWNPTTPITIEGVGSLRLRRVQGSGLTPDLLAQPNLSIRFRQGGERLQPSYRGHRHALKKLFQEANIPPWERDRTPILYQGESIVAVAGLCDCAAFRGADNQHGLLLEWDKCF